MQQGVPSSLVPSVRSSSGWRTCTNPLMTQYSEPPASSSARRFGVWKVRWNRRGLFSPSLRRCLRRSACQDSESSIKSQPTHSLMRCNVMPGKSSRVAASSAIINQYARRSLLHAGVREQKYCRNAVFFCACCRSKNVGAASLYPNPCRGGNAVCREGPGFVEHDCRVQRARRETAARICHARRFSIARAAVCFPDPLVLCLIRVQALPRTAWLLGNRTRCTHRYLPWPR